MKQEIERRLTSFSNSQEQSSMVHLEARSGDTPGDKMPAIVGYTAVFGVDTEIHTFFGSFREQIKKGAFRRAIREGQDVRALRNHEPDNLLGRTSSKTLRLKEDDTGLFIEVDPPNNTIGHDTVESVRRGDLSGMSFAFIVRREKWINGEDGSADLRIIEDVDLFDVGPVTFPAYEQTSADLRTASRVYQTGCAMMDKQIPVAPPEATPLKVLDVGDSSAREETLSDAGAGGTAEAFREDETVPVTQAANHSAEVLGAPAAYRYRARLAQAQSAALRNSIERKLLTK